MSLAVIVGAEHGAHGTVGLDANGGRRQARPPSAPANRDGATPNDST